MKLNVKVAGVNDEPSPTWALDEALDVLEEAGLHFVELRAADGLAVDQMDDATFRRVARRIRERGFEITTYLAQLGQCVPDEASREDELSRTRRAIERAEFAGARLIRLMGYKKGKKGAPEIDWHARAVDLVAEMTQISAEGDKILILENPPDARGSCLGTAGECLSALERIDSPHLRLNFDGGNFGAHGEDAIAAFEKLKNWVGNVHVKDIGVLGDTKTYCVAGEGRCGYPEIFRGLAAMGYSGFVTAEPHLGHAQSHHTSGREGFLLAVARMCALLEQAGFEVQKSA